MRKCEMKYMQSIYNENSKKKLFCCAAMFPDLPPTTYQKPPERPRRESLSVPNAKALIRNGRSLYVEKEMNRKKIRIEKILAKEIEGHESRFLNGINMDCKE